MADELSQGRTEANPSYTDISADIERFAEIGVLGTLLADRSTGGNIIWASNVFSDKGESYAPEDEIFVRDITGENAGIIRTRASKDRDDQIALTRAHAEVFTPLWVVRKMVDWADEAWYEARESSSSLWQQYVRSPRLELTCGEAPFLASRYDAADGMPIPVGQRCGVLDRKLLEIGKHVRSRRSWMRHALAALKSTYGYEYQGDNLLIARVNVLTTMEDHLDAKGWDNFTLEEYQQIAEVVSWNIWQMDGLKDCVPNGALGIEEAEMRLPGFDELFGLSGEQMEIGVTRGRGAAKIYDWENGHEVEFQVLKRKVTLMDKEPRIRFDFILGNPPYQEEATGDSNTATPVYHHFMDASYELADGVMLITPARFLFNAGYTPKPWNRRMLNDPHFKVEYYNPDSSAVFNSVDIKGGVAITYRDINQDFGAIETFTRYPMLNQVLHTVTKHEKFASITSIIVSSFACHFTDALYVENPELRGRASKGHDFDVQSNSFDRFPEVFFDIRPDDADYVRILGRENNQRRWKYIRRNYINDVINLNKFKAFYPKAVGTGNFGEVLPDAILGQPGDGATVTFISIGAFEEADEASNCVTYMKTKFARTMLGVLKVTQDMTPAKFKYVPDQDFSSSSDIDWTQSVTDIDQQLYAKYGLTQDEIDFIETHVKEMQ